MNASRCKLLLLAALLALPFVLASVLFALGWRPPASVNHGTLVSPPLAAPERENWLGGWSLVLLHSPPCGLECAARLDELRRLRISLAAAAPRTRVVPFSPRPGEFGGWPAGSVVVVDPGGRAMLRYPPGADASGMRADLERLLKYARTA